jgi:hypothetical protein
VTKAVVLQPSYIPWRGYFDLIRRSDVFVFYDDVQYDKHGWRNRNRIKSPSGLHWLTIPVHAKGNTVDRTPINQIRIDRQRDWRRSHLEQLRHNYRRAPFFKDCATLLDAIYAGDPEYLADFTIRTTVQIAQYLGLTQVRFERASTLHATGSKNDRLLEVLKSVGTTHYISGPSARAYIDERRFLDAGISLEYIDYSYEPYEQLYPPYEPAVSILDLLFMKGDDAQRFIRPVAKALAG